LERSRKGFARSEAIHPERTNQSLPMEKGRNIMKQSKGATRQISTILYSKSFSWVLAAALILGACMTAYAAGEDKGQPAPGSFESVKQLAEKGNAEAQLKLAQMYQEGKGIAQNLQEAVKWSRKAAEQGLAQAQFFLGQMYATGKGVAKDAKEATKWLQKAADQGLQAAKDEIKKLGGSAQEMEEEIDKAIKMIR
jgi:TPR repeat protein